MHKLFILLFMLGLTLLMTACPAPYPLPDGKPITPTTAAVKDSRIEGAWTISDKPKGDLLLYVIPVRYKDYPEVYGIAMQSSTDENLKVLRPMALFSLSKVDKYTYLNLNGYEAILPVRLDIGIETASIHFQDYNQGDSERVAAFKKTCATQADYIAYLGSTAGVNAQNMTDSFVRIAVADTVHAEVQTLFNQLLSSDTEIRYHAIKKYIDQTKQNNKLDLNDLQIWNMYYTHPEELIQIHAVKKGLNNALLNRLAEENFPDANPLLNKQKSSQ